MIDTVLVNTCKLHHIFPEWKSFKPSDKVVKVFEDVLKAAADVAVVGESFVKDIHIFNAIIIKQRHMV